MKAVLTALSIPLVSGLLIGSFLAFPAGEFTGELPLPEAPPEPVTVRVLFVGDIMLDRYIRKTMDTRGASFVLSGVRPLLEAPDVTAGNLEGPITDMPSVSSGTQVGDTNNMRFTFSPPVASMLSSFGFDVLTIGNNHIRDFGTSGVLSTMRHLEAAGIAVIGDPTGAIREPVIKDVRGVRIAFISYNEFIGGDDTRALRAIRDAKRQHADLIAVMPHWGEEYEVTPRTDVRDLAVMFQEAGADLVAGSHSHIVSAQETIGSTRVYYSLGNFVFDQYWEKSVRCGLAVTAVVTKHEDDVSISYEETEVGMTKEGKTVLGCGD